MSRPNLITALLVGILVLSVLGCDGRKRSVADAGTGADASLADATAGDDGSLTDASAMDAGDGAVRPARRELPALPLRTEGRWILDATGERFKLAGVNWYGAEELDFVVAGLDRVALPILADRIASLGFNVVRLPFSNELVAANPAVPMDAVSANPELAGLRALEVLDRVIEALAYAGLVVILDNHVSAAGWCCEEAEGLWYTAEYPEETWLDHWRLLARRYRDQPAVVGVDLRNELRGDVTWGGDPSTDWKAAATRGGNAVLAENANLLILVEGLEYSSDFGGAFTDPVVLDVPGRLVYSPHDYGWFHGPLSSYDDLATPLGDRWGFLLTQDRAFTAPVVIGEFGTCHTSTACISEDGTDEGRWFHYFRQYLQAADIDWIYWSLNGTQARAEGREHGAPDSYGVLDPEWQMPASAEHMDALRELQPITQRPE